MGDVEIDVKVEVIGNRIRILEITKMNDPFVEL